VIDVHDRASVARHPPLTEQPASGDERERKGDDAEKQSAESHGDEADEHRGRRGRGPGGQEHDRNPDVVAIGPGRGVGAHAEERELDRGTPAPPTR